MSPPGCCRGESEIRNQWARHVATHPSSFSILKTPGNSQQLPCLNRALSEEAPCPQELSCIKLSAQCLSTSHTAMSLSLACITEKLLCRSQTSLLLIQRKDALLCKQPSSSTYIPSRQHSSLAQMLATDLCTSLLAEGTFSGDSNRTLHTHCPESKASGQPS